MSRTSLIVVVAPATLAWACAYSCAAAAAGQTEPPATSLTSAAPSETAPSTITVTAAPQAYKSSIDRKSYSLANDLQKASGSLADVLRNVPSVSVDAQGNISLRGDPSVTILIDGKPSALFSDMNRADAVQQLPADQFERVEVMTTPSAAFRPDGTGGIINLISRKAAPGKAAEATTSGSAHLNVGTGGRYNGGANGAYAAHGLSLSGAISARHAVQGVDTSNAYQFADPVTGAATPAKAVSNGRLQGNSVSLNGQADYDLDGLTRLSAGVNHFQDRSHSASTGGYLSDAASGPLALDYDTDGFWHGHFSSNGLTLGAVRKLPGPDHELSVQVNTSQDHVKVSTGSVYDYQVPVQPSFYQDLSEGLDDLQLDLKVEYKTPTPGGGKLTTGYEGRIDQDRIGYLGLTGTTRRDATFSDALTDVFKFDQQVHALYATFDQSLGKLTVQPGVRLEETVIELDQATQATRAGQAYFGVYPTLELTYELDDDRQLKAGYSRRVQRPGINSLDPFRREESPTSFSAGNPALKPETTNAVEVGYEYRKKTTDYQATLYYRDKAGLFTQVQQEIAPAVLLTREENLGRGRDAGVEMAATRDLTKTLSVNVSTNVFWSQVDAANLGILDRRSAVLWSGRLSLNFQATKADFIQISASQGGKQLTAQGYRDDLATVNLGWRHTFDKQLAGVVTLQDPFDSYRERTVVDTPSLKDQQVFSLHIRALFIGFTYALGAAGKPSPPAFDFGQPQAK